VIAFRRVVVHHIQDHLDARPVQRLDHVPELVDRAQRAFRRAIAVVGREERDRRVAPIVGQPHRRILRVELKNRQQLYGRDAQVPQIGNLLDQARIRSAQMLGQPRACMAREPAHVHLVDHGAVERLAQRRIVLPIVVVRVDDHALHGVGRVVAWPLGRFPAEAPRHSHAVAIRV